ncbi:transmembrane protein, putative [Bodo saltans]|uniref:Transmembrane protein, putative n=1 Tax=Bodo saltans TaxID=75058 RepID=A0A0S4IY18_BODSA|nr:transmembrane protein, putative [Bodo saltans]|eukprot:CUG14128.1 transmembrane protein, putative [Bodo saltans]
MQGFSLPGVYTILYSQHDPAHPLSCPPVSFTQLLHVYRAQVVTDTIVVCHSEAEVRAVPLPRELQRDFYALWEIVSREDELSLAAGAGPLTSGADLAGMRFDMSARPETRITGLPFGIVTIRWAIYKNVKEGDDDVLVGTTTMAATNGSSNIVLRRVLVDEARVTLFVLTENLRSNRVVTLADAIDVPITSSTHQWRFAETGTQQGPSSGGVLARSSSLSFRYINQSLSRAATPAGSAVMSVRQLRVGVTRLYYELRPSLRIAFIERLKNLTCPVAPATSLFEVERVTAFLSLKNISGHHECDAYFQNRVNFTLCLEAGDRTTAQFFAERVALIDAEKMERIVKSDATAFAASVGCSVPWWASEDAAEWTSVYAFEDQRCFFFAARAKRHLSSREAAHPLLEAAAFPRGSLGGADSVNFAECPAGLDIFSARLVEGVDFVSPAGGQGMKPFLPILEPSSLRPPTALLRAGLRPLIGFDAREDDVASETQLAMESPTAASVTLQLDHTQASLPYSAAPLLPTDDVSSTAPRPPVTILDKCLDNTLTADDVVALWAPTEGGGSSVAVNPLVAQRWRDYVTQAGGKHVVRCEPLWPSLDHMLPRPQDTLETLATRRAQVFPPNRQELVTLAALEDQLSALNRSHYWTRDGIEVTGLSPELANALLRKKVTAKQFEEIQRHRATQAQQQHAQLHSAPIHTIDNAEGTVFLSTHNNEDASVAIPASQRRRRFEEALAVLQSWREAHKLPRPAVSLPGPYRTDSPIVALRVMLPAAPRFVAPANFAVRMVLSKDVVCGSSVRHDSPQVSSQPPPPTAATVVFQRLVIRDEPPVINVAPLRVKQCDVEGALPPIVIRLENIGFADEVVNFTFADWRARIELTELENLNVTALLAMEGNRHAYSDNIVGLKPCLGTLLRGARVTLDSKTSQKILQLQFAPCPQFLMLSNEEYNERQEGDVLLARLQHPRYFKVVVRNVVGRDSFTYSTTASSAPSSAVATTYVSAETVSFTITVAPTLVRLHVRPGGHHLQGEDFVTFHDSPSLPPAATAPQQLVVAGAAMICESAMKHDGFELGFELVGDHWHYAVGRSFLSISNNNGDEATPIMQPNDEDYQEAQVVLSQSRRTQQDVSLLNAFSLVEHHILDAATYAFLYIGGGHYQSHFVHYLFGSVLRDAVGSMNDAQQRTLVQSNRKDTENGGDVDDNSYAARQKFVHRYNDTFIGLRLPAASSNSDAKTPKHRHVGNNNMLPPSLEFNTIEEILFAVPGITTKCKGCLLADRTFFVAGDGSGIFSVGTSGAGALAARKLSAPFEIPFDGFLSAPRTIAYEWLCAFTASSFAQQVLRKYTPPTKSLHSLLGSAYFVVDVFVLSPRDELGRTLPLASQPRKVVSSLPAAVEGNSITRFSFSEQALEFAVDVLASDYTGKYLKPHLKPVFDYHVLPNGAVAVNATTTLSLCIAPPPNAPGGSGNDCTVLYYKPSRLLVDRRGQVAASILSSSWLQPEVLVHHAVTVCVFRWSQVQGASRPSLFMPALLAASLFVFSATIPVVAIGMWLLVWADVFRRQAGLWPVAFFGLHGLMYAIGAARRV